MASGEAKSTEDIIVGIIVELIHRRGEGQVTVGPETSLLSELEMDSLELAELSTALADDVGPDPFSEGLFPDTVAELVAFYEP